MTTDWGFLESGEKQFTVKTAATRLKDKKQRNRSQINKHGEPLACQVRVCIIFNLLSCECEVG